MNLARGYNWYETSTGAFDISKSRPEEILPRFINIPKISKDIIDSINVFDEEEKPQIVEDIVSKYLNVEDYFKKNRLKFLLYLLITTFLSTLWIKNRIKKKF